VKTLSTQPIRFSRTCRPFAAPASVQGDFDVTVVLDDEVSDLSRSDFDLSNGTLLSLRGGCHNYVARIRPRRSPVTIRLPSGSVIGNRTGLPNQDSNNLIIGYADTSAPRPSFVELPANGVFVDSINLGIDFGEAVTGYALSDLFIQNAEASNPTVSGGIYRFDLTRHLPGDIMLHLPAGSVQDNQGRGNLAASANLTAVLSDQDGDGLADVDEMTQGTDMLQADTDGDGLSSDQSELYGASDPTQSSSTPIANVPASLVAYYPFDEGSGNMAFDLALQDGLAQDATEAKGTIGWTSTDQLLGAGALALDGSSSLTTSTPLSAQSTSVTFSVWFQPETASGGDGIYTHRTSANRDFWGMILKTDRIDYRVANANIESIGFVQTGTWHHAALVWENTGRRTIYYDGVAHVPFVQNITTNFTATNLWHIGDDPCCSNRGFDGLIDDLAVFDGALNAEAIHQIYRAGLNGLPVIHALQPAPLTITMDLLSPQAGLHDQHLLRWTSEAGASYSVRTSSDLTLPFNAWHVIYNEVQSTGFETQFSTRYPRFTPEITPRFFLIEKNK